MTKVRNSRVRVVNDYADTRFSRILVSSRKRKSLLKLFFFSYGAQLEFFDKQISRKSLDTVSLSSKFYSRAFSVFFNEAIKINR